MGSMLRGARERSVGRLTGASGGVLHGLGAAHLTQTSSSFNHASVCDAANV